MLPQALRCVGAVVSLALLLVGVTGPMAFGAGRVIMQKKPKPCAKGKALEARKSKGRKYWVCVRDTKAPGRPGDLRSAPRDHGVILVWNRAKDNGRVASYRISRDGKVIAQQKKRVFKELGLSNGKKYAYAVQAVDEAGNVGRAAEVAQTPAPDSGDLAAPTAPADVAATPGNNKVVLSWTASQDDIAVTAYQIWRNGELVGTSPIPSYTDTGLTNGVAYQYKIIAVDAAGNQSTAAELSATPRSTVDTEPPTKPDNFRVSAGDRENMLSWDASTDNVGVDHYTIKRDGEVLAIITDTSFRDGGLTNGTSYSYELVAYDGLDNASPAATASATPRDQTAPGQPAGLEAVAGDNQVSLSWTAATDNIGVTGYRVYRNGSLLTTSDVPYYIDASAINGSAYSYTVAALDAAGNESTASVAATATPVPTFVPDITPPTVPSAIVAQAGQGKVSLSWAASSDNIGVTGYRVYRLTAGSYIQIAAPVSTSYIDTGLTNGTSYSYKVTAIDAAGNESAQSTAVSATPVDTTAPSVPSGLAATAGNAQVSLTWTASTDNVGIAGYRIYRLSGGAYTQIATTSNTFYNNTGLTNGTSYSYKVAAYDAAGNVSGQSTAASATPAVPTDATAPSVPTGLSATGSSQQVALSWVASSDNLGVSGYRIYRSSGGSTYTQIATSATTSYTNTGLTNGTAYSYKVAAYDAANNESAQSTAATATPADTTAPSLPTGLTATAGVQQVALSWTASSDNVGVTGYKIYRNGTLLTTTTSSFYTDTGLTAGTSYAYRVSAIDLAGNESAQSVAASATPTAAPDTTAPSVPAGLAATAGDTKVTLSWTASTDAVGVTGYKIYRNGTQIATSATTSFTVTGLTNGTSYSFTVAAYDAAGNTSVQSTAVSATPKAAPDTQAPTVPTNVVAKPVNSTRSITVTWTASTDNVGIKNYKVYRSTFSGSTGTCPTTITNLAGSPLTTTFADTGGNNQTTYCYQISAIDAAGNESARSPVISTYAS